MICLSHVRAYGSAIFRNAVKVVRVTAEDMAVVDMEADDAGVDMVVAIATQEAAVPQKGAEDSKGGAPAFGGPGLGPRLQAPVPRPAPNFGNTVGDKVPPKPWHSMSPQNMGLSNPNIRCMGSQLPPGSGDLAIPLNSAGPFSVPSGGSLPGFSVSSSSTSQLAFNQPPSQVPTVGQQISPLQKPLQSPQGLSPSFQLHPLAPVSYSQTQTTHSGQLQVPLSASLTPFSQAFPLQHSVCLSSQLPTSRPQVQQNVSSTAPLQNPLTVNLPPNLQPSSMPTTTNQQQLPVPMQHQMLQPLQQSPSQIAKKLSCKLLAKIPANFGSFHLRHEHLNCVYKVPDSQEFAKARYRARTLLRTNRRRR